MYYKQAQTAANWWVEQIKMRCSELYPDRIARDGSNFVIVDNSLKDGLSQFQSLLTDDIQVCLEKCSYLSLSCCYMPNRQLSKLAKLANIPDTYFPIRASMEIFDRYVQVALNDEELYTLPLPSDEL